MIEPRDVALLLRRFSAQGDGEAVKSQELSLALLEWAPEPLSRDTFTPGHITCTGVVLSPDRERVLLVHHRRLSRWLLPGGHVEREDTAIAEVARREVIEETGAVLDHSEGILVGVDVHPIPAKGREPLHLHHDLIFAFQAATDDCRCSIESRAVVWCNFEEFDRYTLPGSIRRSAHRATRIV